MKWEVGQYLCCDSKPEPYGQYWPLSTILTDHETQGGKRGKRASHFPLNGGVFILPIHLSQGQDSSLGLESLTKVTSLSTRHFSQSSFVDPFKASGYSE